MVNEKTCRAALREIGDSLDDRWETEPYISCTKTHCESCVLEITDWPFYGRLEKEFGEEDGLKAAAYSRGALEVTLDEWGGLAVSGDIPLYEFDPKLEEKTSALAEACGGLEDIHTHDVAVHVHIENCPMDKFLKATKKL